MLAVLRFPDCRPDSREAGATLWALQGILFEKAEVLLGARDAKKVIYQPVFRDGGPRVRNTVEMEGAFAELSLHAAGYWPTVVYELAHETVHLLDPVVGYTNWLEEATAVEFSVLMSRALTLHPMQPEEGSTYAKARALLDYLPAPVLESVGELRRRYGPLSGIKVEQILTELPDIPKDVAELCAAVCKGR